VTHKKDFVKKKIIEERFCENIKRENKGHIQERPRYNERRVLGAI